MYPLHTLGTLHTQGYIREGFSAHQIVRDTCVTVYPLHTLANLCITSVIVYSYMHINIGFRIKSASSLCLKVAAVTKATRAH